MFVDKVRITVIGPSTFMRLRNRVICSSPGIGMSGIGNVLSSALMSPVKSSSAVPSPTMRCPLKLPA